MSVSKFKLLRGSSDKYKGVSVKDIGDAIVVNDMINKWELFPCYAYRNPSKPLVIFGLNCTISIYVLINSINPLRVRIFKNGFVKLIDVPYFVDNSESIRARMMLNELFKILKDRNYTDEAIENLWDSLCQKIIMSIFCIYHKLDCSLVEHKFFHVFTVDFIVDESLNPWVFNINSDPNFTKKSNFDDPKCEIIEDILKNCCLQIVKNMKTKEFKKIRLKENSKQFVKIIADTSSNKNKKDQDNLADKFTKKVGSIQLRSTCNVKRTKSSQFLSNICIDDDFLATDQYSIQKRLFDKIDVELTKMRNRANEHIEHNKSKLKELEKTRKNSKRKIISSPIIFPKYVPKPPSVQEIMNIISINEKRPANYYNVFDPKKIEEEYKRMKMKKMSLTAEKEIEKQVDFNTTQQK